jgi:hypothetical protein
MGPIYMICPCVNASAGLGTAIGIQVMGFGRRWRVEETETGCLRCELNETKRHIERDICREALCVEHLLQPHNVSAGVVHLESLLEGRPRRRHRNQSGCERERGESECKHEDRCCDTSAVL